LHAPVWMPDGKGLVVQGQFTRNDLRFVSYPDGKSQPITRDTNNYSDPSVSADGRVLATVLREPHAALFTMPTAAESQLKQVSSGAPVFQFTWTADNRMLRSSESGLTVLDPATGATTSLNVPSDTIPDTPFACPDGRYIVFTNIGGKAGRELNTWRMDAGGGNLKQLSDSKLEQNPMCTSSGWVVFADNGNGSKLMKVPIDGGKAQPVSDQLSADADVSPDGKAVAFAAFGHLAEHIETIILVALDNNQVLKTMPFEHPRSGHIRFSPDQKAIVYPVSSGSADNLWSQPLDGSPGKQITNFTTERIGDFHWSRDGKTLGLIRGHTDSDVVLINDMQP